MGASENKAGWTNRRAGGNVFSRILVALDGSDGSRAALQQAVELAKALNAALHGMVVKGRLPEQATVLSEVKGE